MGPYQGRTAGPFQSATAKALPGGGFGYLPHRNWLTSDYLAAALPLGLRVRRCAEPRRPYPLVDPDGGSVAYPDEPAPDEPAPAGTGERRVPAGDWII